MKLSSASLVAAAVGTVLWVNAGSLTPPGGPVAPTMKTLVEVEPRTAVNSLPGSASAVYVISLPGSYYLTGDVIGVSAKHGIEITVGGVSLDLRGFRVVGAGGSLKGISASGDATIENGALIGWGAAGVDICQNAILRNLRASACTTGFSVCRGVVSDCVAQQNQTGFIGFGALFHDCVATSNTAVGFNVSNGSSVTGCTAGGNVRGITASGGSLVSGCTVFGNSTSGIEVADNCRVVGNDVDNNIGDGLLAYNTSNSIDSNSLTRNGTGLHVTSAGNWIVRNVARGNTNGYTIAAGNDYAQIIAAPGAAFVATNPWANFIDQAAASCTDVIKNGTETGIDCGGPNACPRCPAGQGCNGGSDCQSFVCTGALCQAPSCTDGIQNGTETGVDCGGPCPPCLLPNGSACTTGAGCISGNCTDGVCCNSACGGTCQACNVAGSVGTCTNIPSGTDPANECIGASNCNGAGACSAFPNGTTCTLGSQCSSGNCADGVCCDSACNGTCVACNIFGSVGTCANVPSGTDPANECAGASNCNGAGACQPSCIDGVKNGNETDVDCGGGTCPTCPNGKLCTVGSDCSSTHCTGGACVP